MKCYTHRQVDAVAVCKSCGRALCPECVTEVDKGCACKNRCEEDVSVLNDLVVRGSKAYTKASSVYSKSGIFLLFMGIAFFVFGLPMALKNGSIFFLALGIGFIAYGISQLITARKYKEK